MMKSKSLKSENYTLTSRLQNLDDISKDMNILKAKKYKLTNTNQDMHNKFSMLKKQTLNTSTQSFLILNEHSKLKKN